MNTSQIAILFGGPSNERDIALDSARSFYDAIRFAFDPQTIELHFIDKNCRCHLLDPKWIYCNTIEDFESSVSKNDSQSGSLLSSVFGKKSIESYVICPLIHGAFGEDGKLTEIFEKLGAGAVLGSSSEVLSLCINKAATLHKIAKMGLHTPRGITIHKSFNRNLMKEVQRAWRAAYHEQLPSQVIVKPNDCGSSDGVSYCALDSPRNSLSVAEKFSQVIRIEEVIQGHEFSIIVLERRGLYLPLIPTGIRFARTSESIYSRQKKYMPGSGAFHEIPIKLSSLKISEIQSQATGITKGLSILDWCRLDGFVTDVGDIIWLEVNPIPGCGQDSFLFQQTTAVGIQPMNFCSGLVSAVARRGGVPLERVRRPAAISTKAISIIGGGMSSEKDVSRMSWLNVCRKLSDSRLYSVKPVFLDSKDRYLEVPAFFTMQHTVDEIEDLLEDCNQLSHLRELTNKLKRQYPLASDLGVCEIGSPKQTTLEELDRDSKFLFIALHGGAGEDGRLQSQLEDLHAYL